MHLWYMEKFQQKLIDSRRLGMQHVYNPNTHKAEVEGLQAEVSLRCIEKFFLKLHPWKKMYTWFSFLALYFLIVTRWQFIPTVIPTWKNSFIPDLQTMGWDIDNCELV